MTFKQALLHLLAVLPPIEACRRMCFRQRLLKPFGKSKLVLDTVSARQTNELDGGAGGAIAFVLSLAVFVLRNEEPRLQLSMKKVLDIRSVL